MNPVGAAGLDDQYYQQQMQEQRKKRMLILFIVLSTSYVFLRTSDQSSSSKQLRGNQKGRYNEGNIDLLEDDTSKAQKLLEDSESTIDGYKELYKAFYERYDDEQNGKENPTPDLKGNKASDLLFATFYSLKRKLFNGFWNSHSQENTLGFLDNRHGYFTSYIDSYVKNELRFYVIISDDQYIDHKSLIGYVIIKKDSNFTMVDREVNFKNLTLVYLLENNLHYIYEGDSHQKSTIPVKMKIEFNEQIDTEKYINKYSPYLTIKIQNDDKQTKEMKKEAEGIEDKEVVKEIEEIIPIYQLINITAEADLEEEVIS